MEWLTQYFQWGPDSMPRYMGFATLIFGIATWLFVEGHALKQRGADNTEKHALQKNIRELEKENKSFRERLDKQDRLNALPLDVDWGVVHTALHGDGRPSRIKVCAINKNGSNMKMGVLASPYIQWSDVDYSTKLERCSPQSMKELNADYLEKGVAIAVEFHTQSFTNLAETPEKHIGYEAKFKWNTSSSEFEIYESQQIAYTGIFDRD